MPGARQLAGPSGADRIPQWAQRHPQMARTKAAGRNARKARSMLDAAERSALIHHRADSVSTACLANSIPRSRALVRISSFVGKCQRPDSTRFVSGVPHRPHGTSAEAVERLAANGRLLGTVRLPGCHALAFGQLSV